MWKANPLETVRRGCKTRIRKVYRALSLIQVHICTYRKITVRPMCTNEVTDENRKEGWRQHRRERNPNDECTELKMDISDMRLILCRRVIHHL